MTMYEKHVFVCTSGSACPLDGDADGVHKVLKQKVGEHPQLKGRVRVNKSGCLNQCGHGPLVVVYPEGVWYWQMTVEKAREVFERHLLHGEPVEAYRYVVPPGDHKLARDAENRVVCDPCHPARVLQESSGASEKSAPRSLSWEESVE